MRTSDFWKLSSAEVSRPLIDTLLFDRVFRLPYGKSLPKITTSAKEAVKMMVSDVPDQVNSLPDFEHKIDGYLCPLLVFEAKPRKTFSTAVSQCATYMGRSSVHPFFIGLMQVL
jgi:hypothetical protein